MIPFSKIIKTFYSIFSPSDSYRILLPTLWSILELKNIGHIPLRYMFCLLWKASCSNTSDWNSLSFPQNLEMLVSSYIKCIHVHISVSDICILFCGYVGSSWSKTVPSKFLWLCVSLLFEKANLLSLFVHFPRIELLWPLMLVHWFWNSQDSPIKIILDSWSTMLWSYRLWV